jgi:hypothetical protein
MFLRRLGWRVLWSRRARRRLMPAHVDLSARAIHEVLGNTTDDRD